MQLITIINAVPALQKLAGADLSLKLYYKATKIIDAAEKEIKFYYDTRKKILEKYRDVNAECEEGEIKILPEFVDAAKTEIAELDAMEVDLKIKKLKIPDTENIKLSVNDGLALKNFIEIIFTESEDD